MKLRFTPRAAQDIAAIADYIRARNPGAARKVRAAIFSRCRIWSYFRKSAERKPLKECVSWSPANIPIWSITGSMRRQRKSSSSLSSILRVSGSMKTVSLKPRSAD